MDYVTTCTHNKPDCFGLVPDIKEKRCRCLTSTYFGKRPCPFYKPREQAQKEWAEAMRRAEARR